MDNYDFDGKKYNHHGLRSYEGKLQSTVVKSREKIQQFK